MSQHRGVASNASADPSVVLVSADPSLGKAVRQGLEGGAAQITVTADIDRLLVDLEEDGVSLVIADYEIARDRFEEILAQANSPDGAPVIVVASSFDEIPRCLDLGASDFMLKPVSTAELANRVALHRPGRWQRAGMKNLGSGLSIDTAARRAVVDGETVDLTPREFRLLEFLAARPGVAFTREELLARVWGSSPRWQNPATVTEHIYRLRRKLEQELGRPRWIVTAPGHGYRFEFPDD